MNNTTYKAILDQLRDPRIRFAYIDLFCGAGGTSTGVNNSKHGRVVACVNHDKTAIASHSANHPNAMHFVEDIRTLNLSGLVKLVQLIRKEFPHIKIVLWASLECTNFSKAKGGQPRDADSRTLAEHLYRYVEVLDPDLIQIENVVEFMAWGPLDENGKPLSRRQGIDWMRWREHMKSYGYRDDWRELNAADFGAYTSRNRLFGVFAKHGLPIEWPLATHAKKPSVSMFGTLLHKWKPVKECLDFSDEGKSIFQRKKPLVEKTLERIYAGLVKFVGNGDDQFITKYYSGDPSGKNISIHGPAGTITTVDCQAIVTPSFLMASNGECPSAKVFPTDSPCRVITASDNKALVMMKYHGKGENLVDPEMPCSTLTTRDRVAVVFLDQQYGKSTPASTEEPGATLTVNPKLAACFIERPFTSGGGKLVDIEGPMGALMTVPKANMITCENWIMVNAFDRSGTSIEEPAPTVVATGTRHYLMNPQYTNKGGSIDAPAFTLIARMDKMPPYLVETIEGNAAIVIYDTDSPMMKKIKIFMAHHGIVDIKMRMLKVQELKVIQGFPADYVLTGTQTEQKKHIGNSVEQHVVIAWVNAYAARLEELELVAA